MRKKKVIPNLLRLNIQCHGDEHTTPIYIPLQRGDEICTDAGFNLFYLQAVIQTSGYLARDDVTDEKLRIVEACDLVTCAANIKMIKDVLSSLPHDNVDIISSSLSSYASYFNTPVEELQTLLQKPQKTIIHTILSNLNGGVGKAPPNPRLSRLRYPDMQILQNKEMQDKTNTTTTTTKTTWRLCQPCNNTTITAQHKQQTVSNLPLGSHDSISHHHKLTRGQYLENKKNHQTHWFVQRIHQFKSRPRSFLDVGGGRGDLAVQIALEFTDCSVIAVDCNTSSIEAGKCYAEQCGVSDRIAFVEMNFSRYVQEYDGDTTAVDCIVALHACGDLSDMALSLARDIGCNFIICPCCYPKRYLDPFVPYWHRYCTEVEVDSLTRLVELDDRREVSRRAMVVINSMRRDAFGEGVGLEEFDSMISKRNIVLVGDF